MQRELIRRQQQSDEFAQQLRQSQEALRVPPGDLEARTRLESQQLDERQRLENLDAEQLQRAGKDTPPEFRPQQRERMKQERRPLVDAPPERNNEKGSGSNFAKFEPGPFSQRVGGAG